MSEKKTVLYVDDEQTNLLLFKINFQKRFNVITGISGFEGLDHLRNNPEISIVISDMKMPEMNGLEFIRLAKVEFPNVKFYILTGFDITPEIEDALAENIIHKYFSKPFKIKEIEDSIVEVFNP